MDPQLIALLAKMFGPNASTMLAGSGAMPPPPDQGPLLPTGGKDQLPAPGLPGTAPNPGGFVDQSPVMDASSAVDSAGAALAGPGGPAGFAPQGPELPGDYSGSPATNPNLAPVGAAPPPPTSGVDKALAALRGTVVPKPPEPQRVSTPANPGRAPATAPQNNIMQILQMMMAGHPQSAPMSLAQALSGRG